MSGGTVRKTLLAVVCAGTLGSLVGTSGSFPVPYSGGYGPLPMGGTLEPWVPPPAGTGSAAHTTSATVSTSAGTTKVQGFAGGQVKNFGLSPNGYTLILEGSYDTVRLTSQAASTAGYYWIRNPTDSVADADLLVGEGAAALPTLNPATYSFYNAQTASRRLAMVHAGTFDVNVTDGSATLVAVDANDATFCSRTTTLFGLNGKGNVSYSVSAVGPNMTPVTGSCVCNPAGESDSASCDGTIGLMVTLTAGSTNGGPINVTCGGGTPESAALAAGQSQVFQGNLTSLTWTYAAAGSTLSWSVKGN